jgi:hypothetical protein
MTNSVKTSAQWGVRAAALLAAAVALQGCYEDRYTAHRDGVTFGVGDSIASNSAIQTIDPWPESSDNPDIHMDADRARIAIERYQQNKSIPPRGLSTTTVSAQSGPGDQASAQLQQ